MDVKVDNMEIDLERGDEAFNKATRPYIRGMFVLGGLALLGIGAGYFYDSGHSKGIKENYPIKIHQVAINNADGYEIITDSGDTNYFRVDGDIVRQINSTETIQSAVPRWGIVKNLESEVIGK